MARSVPLSRSTLRVGGGSAFFVRQEATIRSAIPNGEILLSYPTPKEAQSVVDSLTTK
jgi:hypothetical protein